jgi:Flavin containing amine oxidoreductase
MGQGAALSRRRFLGHGLTLGGAASIGAGGIVLTGCEPKAPPLQRDISSAFIGPNVERGHHLRQAQPNTRAQTSQQARVVIVGAGISGLAAAWALQQRGLTDYVVLDLEAQAGGNSRGHRMSGHLGGPSLACPMGAHYLPVPTADLDRPGPKGLEPVRGLLADLGLMALRSGRWQVSAQGERHLCHSPQERLFIDGVWQEGLLPLANASAQTLASYQQFAVAIKAFQEGGGFAIPLDTSSSTNQRILRERKDLDAITFEHWLDQHGFMDQHLRWYLDYCCRDDYGAGLATVSAWAGIHYFASRHGFQAPQTASRDDHSTSAGVFTWPQGNGWLSEQLAKGLGPRLHPHRLVTRISGNDLLAQRFEPGSSANPSSERWSFEHCIIATPLWISQRLIAFDAGNSSTQAALHTINSTLGYSSWIVANAYLGQALKDRGGAAPAWDNVIYGGQGLGYVDASHQSLRRNRDAAGQPTVLSYYRALGTGQDLRKALFDRPWQSWRDELISDLAAAHPDFSSKLQQLDLARYAHAMAVPTPGNQGEKIQQARQRLVQPAMNLRFAHADLAGYSVFEEAFCAGVRAAESLV